MPLPVCLACDAHVSHVNALSSFCDDCNNRLEATMPDESKVEESVSMVVKYANAYYTDRLYGGPEEGGWWYDTGEPIMSLPFTAMEGEFTWDAHARDNALEQLYKLCEAAGLNPPEYDYFKSKHWTLDGIQFFIENKPGEFFPQKRPHWDMGEDY